MKFERLIGPDKNEYRSIEISYFSPPDKKYVLSLSTYQRDGGTTTYRIFEPNHAGRITLQEVPRARQKLFDQICDAIKPHIDELFDTWEQFDVEEAARSGYRIWKEASEVLQHKEAAKQGQKKARRLSKAVASVGAKQPLFAI